MNGSMMMDEKAVELEVIFGGREPYHHFLREIGGDPSIRKSVVRARVTRDGAWMSLRLWGPPARIDRLVAGYRDWISAFKRLSKIPA